MSVLAPAEILLRKFESNSPLSDAERQAVRSLPFAPRTLRRDQDIVRQGDTPSQCALILSGWACRSKLLPSGKRQIVALHVAGDVPDLQCLLLPLADHNISTLSESVVAFIPHASIRESIARVPSLAHVFWRDTLIDAAVFREWVLNVGQRQAPQRIAHVVCEMFTRLQHVGLATEADDGRVLPWPLTQIELGSATGLSTVHVNRTLQDLRARELIATSHHALTIQDWTGLRELAEFEPDYLSLRGT